MAETAAFGPGSSPAVITSIIGASVISYIVYMVKFHPLAKYPGPWYLSVSSIFLAIISVRRQEPEYFVYLMKKYGDEKPIRIGPNALFFPRPSALKDIYWDAQCNQKAPSYGSGILGPPHMFTTLDGDEHRALRKALSNAPWTIGPLKNEWEKRFDEEINLFLIKMHEHAAVKRTICLSDKMAEFAADIMSMISFTEPFGCVKNQRDERRVLENWRKGLPIFGFASRFEFFREVILKIPKVNLWFLPASSDDSGMGWLMMEAQRQVATREKQCADQGFHGTDFLQHCLDARYADGSTLTHAQKVAHVTLLIQAGADTTATALSSILRFIVTNPVCLERAYNEIRSADKAALLSSPIQYNETREHLPYIVACIKEGLRLHPPASNLFARVSPKEGKVIDGHFVPGGVDITSHAYSIQRNKDFYGEDAEEFKPERWMGSEKRNFELEAAQFTFGHGFRVCIGKDIAHLEIHKLIPEVIRNFSIELVQPGQYVMVGGVAYNEKFVGKLTALEIGS